MSCRTGKAPPGCGTARTRLPVAATADQIIINIGVVSSVISSEKCSEIHSNLSGNEGCEVINIQAFEIHI